MGGRVCRRAGRPRCSRSSRTSIWVPTRYFHRRGSMPPDTCCGSRPSASAASDPGPAAPAPEPSPPRTASVLLLLEGETVGHSGDREQPLNLFLSTAQREPVAGGLGRSLRAEDHAQPGAVHEGQATEIDQEPTAICGADLAKLPLELWR